MRPATQAVREWLKQVADDSAVRWSLGIFLMLRVSLSLLAIVVTSMQPLPELGHERYVMSLGLEPVSTRGEQLLLEVWQRWDVVHYQRIAAQGYTDDESSAYPPLFPVLISLLGAAWGGNHLLASLVISNLSFFLALVCFYKLTLLDYDEGVARRATIYLSIFPTAFFFLVPYSESLFFLLVMLFFYAARHNRWTTASAAAGLASFTRIQGLVLILPLTYEWLRYTGFNWRRVGSLALLTLPVVLPPAAFVLGRHLAGYPPLASVLAAYWHTTVGGPWHNFVNLFSLLTSRKASGIDVISGAIVIPFLLLTLAFLPRIRPSYALYTAATLLTVLSIVYPPPPMMNLPRHMLLLFPTFVVMAALATRQAVHRAIVYSSIPLLILLTGMFVQWLWVA
ncbi:MAG: hypothetical protein MUP64_14725 [Anaerolineae bacterium]|nr:hypothetical protein [Anaerolineae bacterium]